MPIIELWRGIKFKMYFKDHNPPHFHAQYQGLEATYRINDSLKIEGNLPPRIEKLVLEWWQINKERLDSEWERLSK